MYIEFRGDRRKKNKKTLHEFLSEASEFHAFGIGLMQPWMRFRIEKLPKYLQQDVQREYHYYLLGSFISRLIQGVIVIIFGVKFII